MLEVYAGRRPDSVETDQPGHLSSKLLVLNPFITRLVGSPGYSPGQKIQERRKRKKGEEKRKKGGKGRKTY